MIIITITELIGIFIIVLVLSLWLMLWIINKFIDIFEEHKKGKK